MSFAVGSLVRARGREWVVLPESTGELLMVRPLGGTEDEVTGIYLPLEGDTVTPARFELPDPTKPGDYRSCRLLRDAVRLGFRSSAGPFRSFGHLGVEPRPYQLVPLLMALKLDPVRLLIADDVGIGKTIEAGLIARELLDRGEVRRLAVLCPPPLAEQWQTELREKFHLDPEVVLPSTVTRLERNTQLGESLFDLYPHVIVSTDFIKSERRRAEFLRACPELVIVDEAHTCAAGAAQSSAQHQRYQELLRPIPSSLGRTALTKVTPTQIERLYAERLADALSPTTVRQLHNVLHHAFADAVRKGLLARNVCELVDAPKAQHAQVPALKVEQARAFLEAASGERLHALYVLALTTGLRQGELLALHWANVDLDASVLQVRGTLHRVPGVGVSEKSGLVISDPKTSHSRRPVRLSGVAVAALRAHRARQNAERLALGEAWDDLDLIFCNSIGRPCEARNVIRKSYKPLLERAGVPYLKFHALRHSAATVLLAQGIHPKIVSEMLGHTTISMTLDIYSHVTLDMQKEAADAMDRLFRAAEGS